MKNKIFAFVILMSISFYSQAKINNHPFVKIDNTRASPDNCVFDFGEVNFCDKKHVKAIKEAIRDLAPNFNKDYIVIFIPEGKNINSIA